MSEAVEINLKPRAVNDLEELSETQKKEVLNSLEKLVEKQFQHPDLKPIRDNDDNWIWRLKIKKNETDHRAFIDLENNEFQVLKIAHRDIAYD